MAKDLPPNCVAVGVPARIVKQDINIEGLFLIMSMHGSGCR